MTRMTDERLAEIDKLHSECTQGPYIPCPDKAYIFAPNSKMIASASYREKGVEDGTVELRGDGAGLPMGANHDFLVASWQIVKELREEVLALRGELSSCDASLEASYADQEKIVALCGDPSETPSESVARLVARVAELERQALPLQVLEVEPHPDAAKHVRALLLAGVEVADMRTDGDTRRALLSNFGVQAEAAHRTHAAAVEALRREGCICGEYAAITGLLHPDCKAHPEPATAGLELPAAALFGGPPTDPLLAVVRDSIVPPAEVAVKFAWHAVYEGPDGILHRAPLDRPDADVLDTLNHELADARADVAGLDESHPKCSDCGALATCFGICEGHWGYGCDEHCGHGDEEGHCTALETNSQIAAETAQKLYDQRNDLDRRLRETKEDGDEEE